MIKVFTGILYDFVMNNLKNDKKMIKVPLISTKLAHNIFNKNIYLTLIQYDIEIND